MLLGQPEGLRQAHQRQRTPRSGTPSLMLHGQLLQHEATQKARPMFAASTVPVAPDPALARRVSAEEYCDRPRDGMQLPLIGPVSCLSLILPGGISQSGGDIMLPVQGSAQDIDNARVVLVLAAAGVMVFWRYLFRILLAVIAVVVGVGALALLHGLHG